MTTVAQMIEWMSTLPQDAEVECGVEVSSGYERYMSMVPVDIESCDVFAMAGKTIVRIRGD